MHPNQHPYIGRCYASAIRPEADIITDMNDIERKELFDLIIPEWIVALDRLFGMPFRPNFCVLGNEWAHLHTHLIPRYVRSVLYQGMCFCDPNPRKNYAPYQSQKIPLELLNCIKSEFTDILCK